MKQLRVVILMLLSVGAFAADSSGYRLYDIQPGSIYEKMGFQNGDVIHKINGKKPKDPAKFFEKIFTGKAKHENVKIEVLRKGRKQTMTYEIK